MKLPGWLVITFPRETPPGTPRDTLVCEVRIRRWHPGWWLMLARAYWAAWWRATDHVPSAADPEADDPRKAHPHG